MECQEVLKIFRKYYGSNQKYYQDLHPILYYNDDFYTNPFVKTSKKILEIKENEFENLDKYFKNYKMGINRDNFFKLFLNILRKNNKNFNLKLNEVINQMIYDFDREDLGKEYNLKQYKISKSLMRNTIIDEKFNTNEFIQFTSDYFSFQINLIDNEMRSFYPRNDKLILAPKLFIYHDIINNQYYQIKINNKDWLEYTDSDYKINENTKESETKVSESKTNELQEKNETIDIEKLVKMRLTELQSYAIEHNIDIKKMNNRKTQMINKKKDELISELIGKN